MIRVALLETPEMRGVRTPWLNPPCRPRSSASWSWRAASRPVTGLGNIVALADGAVLIASLIALVALVRLDQFPLAHDLSPLWTYQER